jgi:prevent-host-death family protein
MFKVPRTVNAKRARNNLGEILDTVSYGHQPYLITKLDRPAVIMLSVEDYEDLLDMVDTMSEQLNPSFQKSLGEAREEYLAGQVGTTDDIKKILHR